MSQQEIIEPNKNALIVVEIKEPATVFVTNGLDPLISRITEKAKSRAAELDISTPKNRQALISLSREVCEAKTTVERFRVQLVKDEKERLKLIDQEGTRVWTALEALQKEIRKPVTDWEDADEKRILDHKNAITEIDALRLCEAGISPDEISARIAKLADYKARKWEEFYGPAQEAMLVATEFLTATRDKRIKEIADAAELERLRKEEEARKQKEHDERIAAEAAAKAKQEAEEVAQKAAAEAARVAQEAIDKVEREKKEAAEAAAKREAEQKAEIEKAAREKAAAEQKVIDDAAKAAQVLKDQQEQAEKDQAKALADQRQAAINAKKREDEAQAQRERDIEHTKKINREVWSAMKELPAHPEYDIFQVVIIAIKDGKIPHVKITY